MIYKLAAAFAFATISLGSAHAQAPWCPSGHSQAECDAIWAASHAVADTQDRSEDEQIDAGATAYRSAQAEAATPAPYVPPQARLKMLAELMEFLRTASGQSVIVRRAVYYPDSDGMICGQAFFGANLQAFVMAGDSFRRGLSKEQMERVGCFAGGGVVITSP